MNTALVATVAVILTAGPTTLVVEMIHMSRVAENDLEVTARVRALKMEELRAEDCTPEFWQQLQESRQSENPDFVKGIAAAMGQLRTVTLVERTEDRGRPSYLFRMEYQNMDVLFQIVFDGKKIAYAKGSPAPK